MSLIERLNRLIGVIWKLADNFPPKIRNLTEDYLLLILEKASLKNWEEVLFGLLVIENLLYLSSSLKKLRLIDLEILIDEIKSISSQVEEESLIPKVKVDLEKVFPENPLFQEASVKIVSRKEDVEDNKGGERKEELDFGEGEEEEAAEEQTSNKPKSDFSQSVIVAQDFINSLSFRQRNLIRFLRDKENGASPKEIIEYFPEISPRTIRRELKELLDRGLIFREGEGKFVYYYLNPKLIF